ncbi:Crp/Fnr family transcriptional regulator [Jannaschia sp. CCS1]|uniref:Crp/Fnr family transcriptional regulator n=1 Tax=Jannaschia sp. (strain CCS1) TaxID=290400 RepID=UPI000053BC01|nr:cyclic nucleotide-binding domain-containing protein [Jannaschia sp. CCS1]ABD57088.1 cyclic nucleotide-binding domain (cNMP-BD) protein [Jannaschia sp. CCS1]
MTPDMHNALRVVGQPLSFKGGDTLRQKGTFAPDMLLILTGQVDCVLSEEDAVHLPVGPGTIVGEIGSLTGQAATATLRAVGPVETLSLDARALQRLQQEAPKVASDILRHLTHLLRDRSVQNQDLLAESTGEAADAITVVRCSTLDQMRTAQRVHYDVHCLENGRDSALADHEEGIIIDDLGQAGTTFIAYTGVQVIGMMRVHSGADCDEDVRRLHGAHLTDTRAVITTTALHDAYVSDDVLSDFLGAILTFTTVSGADALLVHCPMNHEARYLARGFVRTGPDVVLDEIGPSVPMILRV